MAYMMDQFESWMKSTRRANGSVYSQETISGYISSLKTHASKLKDVTLPYTDLFNICSLEEFNPVYEKIQNSADYKTVNEAYHRIFSSALKAYQNFLVTLGVQDNRDEFIQWMKHYPNHKYTENTIKRYIYALDKAEEWFNISLKCPILCIATIQDFEKAEAIIKQCPDYDQINRDHGHGDTSAALRIYSLFLTAYLDDTNKWQPSIEEYDPRISKEQWLELLHNPKVFDDDSLQAMAEYYEMGGAASCMQLSKKYKKSIAFYRTSIGVGLASRIADAVGCTLYNQENSKYWPILFVSRKTNSDEAGSYIWKLREELMNALAEFNIGRYLGEETCMQDTVKNVIGQIKTYIASKGFTYEDGLIENFYLSLKSKPFVILAGTSGTGKTRLVRLFAEAVGATANNGRYKMVPVRPDWSDSSDLFGHVDLNGKFVPGTIIDFVKRAEMDLSRPYFLCLDEMNLARVEYYLSDILSVIETRDFQGSTIVSAPLVDSTYYGSDAAAAGRYGTVLLPENLYIIGTVNMDETTFPFSRKVLDRANTIEFSYVDLIPQQLDHNIAPAPMNLPNSFLKTEYLLLAQCADSQDEVEKYCAELQKINQVLQKANAHVGYRVRDEIVFYLLNNRKAELLDENNAMDNEIMQKILPRIQGSSASVKRMLCELFKICAGDYEGYQVENDDIASKMFKAAQNAKYKKSAEKIAFMVRRYEEDGFTSYWL